MFLNKQVRMKQLKRKESENIKVESKKEYLEEKQR